MTDAQLLASLGLATYGPCPYCGTDRLGPADAAPAVVGRLHQAECSVRMATELEFLLDEEEAKADVAEYARLKTTAGDDASVRRWELRDRITDHLSAGYGLDAWTLWFELCTESTDFDTDDTGLTALRVAGLI